MNVLKDRQDVMKLTTTAFIVLGQILMLYFFIKNQTTWTWLTYCQLIGIVNGAAYAYSMFVNKGKLMGVFGFIFNLITALSMYEAHLWGLLIIRIYGIILTLYLAFTGKDGYQSELTYKNEIAKIAIVIISASALYIWQGIDLKSLTIMSLDFGAVIVLTVALFFHAQQSIKQYHWWFASNLFNLVAAILKGNLYLIVVFAFWWVMDNINWINWKKSGK